MEKNYFAYPITNYKLKDANPLAIGHQICDPLHLHGPRIRDYTLIHYVLSGSGTFSYEDHVYSVHAGQCFLILPDIAYTYIADEHTPWNYVWIAFDGTLAGKFAKLFNTPVFDAPDHIFTEIHNLVHSDKSVENVEYFLASLLFQLYYLLSSSYSHTHYALKVKNYISTNYMNDISVEQIANMLSVNRHYLSRIFKAEYGQTIQDYLLSVRLQKAAFLLRQSYTVSQASELVGYSDISNFSRKFKQSFGVSPRQYAKQPIDPPNAHKNAEMIV